jgi:Tfp pilus assembly protein PilV
MRNLRAKHRRKRAICLPEVLVSCLIALIGISALLGSFLNGRLLSTGAMHRTQAMNLARARVEYLKSISYTALSAMPAIYVEPNLALDERDDGGCVKATRFTTLTPEQDGISIAVLLAWNEKAAGAGSKQWTYQLRTWVGFPGRPTVAGG